jgi:hypothetical protein
MSAYLRLDYAYKMAVKLGRIKVMGGNKYRILTTSGISDILTHLNIFQYVSNGNSIPSGGKNYLKRFSIKKTQKKGGKSSP